MAESAKGVTFTFNGQTIGGVESFSVFEGQIRETTFRPLDGTAPVSHPLPPDFGQCVLNLYYDESDAGQAAILSSLRSATKHTMVITRPSGSTETFSAFCVQFPSRGSKSPGTPATLSRVVLRVDGWVS